MTELFGLTPSAIRTASIARGQGSETKAPALSHRSGQPPRKRLLVKPADPNCQSFTVLGQVAKVLLALIEAGETGITPLSSETWSLRLSDHVRKLKTRHGLNIVTLWARHDDGRHARYVLRSKVTIIDVQPA